MRYEITFTGIKRICFPFKLLPSRLSYAIACNVSPTNLDVLCLCSSWFDVALYSDLPAPPVDDRAELRSSVQNEDGTTRGGRGGGGAANTLVARHHHNGRGVTRHTEELKFKKNALMLSRQMHKL